VTLFKRPLSGDANGNGINDFGDVRGLSIISGIVNISSLTITNGRSQCDNGGNGYNGGYSGGGGGGGGGNGMGGGLFIYDGTVTLNSVNLSNNAAIGGNGGNGGNGGGPNGYGGPSGFGASGGSGGSGRGFVYGSGAGGISGGYRDSGGGGGGGGRYGVYSGFYGGGGGGGYGGPGGIGGYGGSGGGGGGGAGLGGGIFIRSGILNLINTNFTNNTATGGNGGNGFLDGSDGSGLGGGLFILLGLSTISSLGSPTFSGNSSTDDDGTETNNDDFFGNISIVPANVTLAVSSASVLEDGTTNLVYTFTRTGPTTNPLIVNYKITGTASATNVTDYTGATRGIGKTITFAAGSATATLTIDPTADTTFEANETVVLTLEIGTGYIVGTTTAITGTITNDDVPRITLDRSSGNVLEDGTTNLVYTFSLTGPTTNALTVNYGITGTADATDYTGATPGTGKTITFAAGSATATLTIDPTADTNIEANETVVLTLARGTGYTVGTTTAVRGFIVNDDFPRITLALSSASVLEDGTTNLVYTFTRTGPTTNTLTVNYGIAGTAVSTDYTGATPGTGKTITFAAGSATATLTIDPTADTLVEPDETVTLTLGTGTGYTVGTETAVSGIITNDDYFPSISINDITVVEGQSPNALLTLSLSSPNNQAVTVNYTTTPFNATANMDYTSQTGTLTIAPNSSFATLSIPILNDNLNESDESFIGHPHQSR
jgi:hypothetical protein